MTDKLRQDFERRFPAPADAVYNQHLDMYCWRIHQKSMHPHQNLWEVWQAAHAKYAGGESAPAVPEGMVRITVETQDMKSQRMLTMTEIERSTLNPVVIAADSAWIDIEDAMRKAAQQEQQQ